MPFDVAPLSGLPDQELQDLLGQFITDDRINQAKKQLNNQPAETAVAKPKTILRKKGQTPVAKAEVKLELTETERQIQQLRREFNMLIAQQYLPNLKAGEIRKESDKHAMGWEMMFEKQIKPVWEELLKKINQQPPEIKNELKKELQCLDAIFAWEKVQNFEKENLPQFRENLKNALKKLILAKTNQAEIYSDKIRPYDLNIFLADALLQVEELGLVSKNAKIELYRQLLYQEVIQEVRQDKNRGNLGEYLSIYILRYFGLNVIHTTPFIDGVRLYNRGDMVLLAFVKNRIRAITIDIKSKGLDEVYEDEFKQKHALFYADIEALEKVYKKILNNEKISPVEIKAVAQQLNDVLSTISHDIKVGVNDQQINLQI